ncbi:MAG: hypothetical protein RJB24_24, partial [Candidatus Parcubacteria bacterium]
LKEWMSDESDFILSINIVKFDDNTDISN